MEFSDLDLSKKYSYADYLKWSFEERVEIIKGEIFKMSPAPNTIHQKVSGAVFFQLFAFLKNQQCSVFSALFDVRLPRKSQDDKEIITVVQPDISVIRDQKKIDAKGCLGAPDIVVEILSAGDNKIELQNKYEVYEETGVKEYWIVSPQYETFLKYTLNEEQKYSASRLLTSGSIVTTPILPGFELDLEEVFRDI